MQDTRVRLPAVEQDSRVDPTLNRGPKEVTFKAAQSVQKDKRAEAVRVSATSSSAATLSDEMNKCVLFVLNRIMQLV